MKLPANPRELDVRLLRDLTNQVNAVTEGNAHAFHGAMTAAPTTGTYNISDEVKNSAPAVAGAPGSQYVVIGWICTAAGTPGTWTEKRCLTGT